MALLTRNATLPRTSGSRPVILYVVTEDWYFLLHRLPMAQAAAPGLVTMFIWRLG